MTTTRQTGNCDPGSSGSVRARGRCEWCGAKDGEPHPATGSRVVLTTAHIYDRDPMACSLLNLRARSAAARKAWRTRKRRAAGRKAAATRGQPASSLLVVSVWFRFAARSLSAVTATTILRTRRSAR